MELIELVREVIKQSPVQVEMYMTGEVRMLGWLVGQVMKKAKGCCKPYVVKKLFLEELKDD